MKETFKLGVVAVPVKYNPNHVKPGIIAQHYQNEQFSSNQSISSFPNGILKILLICG